MFVCIASFVAGLVIGWNFLPQPDWVRELVGKLFGRKNGDQNG